MRGSDPRHGASPPLIAHVIYRLQMGGLETGVIKLIDGLPSQCYRHTIICLTEATAFRHRIRRADVTIHEMHKRPGQDLRLWLRLYRLFRQIRPSLVHSRNIGCLEAQVAAWLAAVPWRVHGEHGWDTADPDGQRSSYRWLRRLHAPLLHRQVALSGELERYLVHQVGIASSSVRRIPNGVDTQHFAPGRDKVLPAGFAAPDTVVFGTVGRMHGVKDQTTLCEAFTRMCAMHVDLAPRMRLVLVGDGPLRQSCAFLLERAGLASQVWLPGSRDDIAAILGSLDVFVLPSRAEGLSNTLQEAMATALPVIATSVGGNTELIEHGVHGSLVPPGDPRALADEMADYARNAVQRRTSGEAGRRRMLEHYSLQRMLDAYHGLYQELLAGCR